ncbi:MAG: tryptophan--tRNA ligase [Sphingomonadaceae bacterium]|uniref:tryptophan--tRNA ligase n=1 Tax=Thermaurantiacus sp. TaxID=2820283 RepID=UPI00298ED5DF|nr:tryptophan--tRNA ligase [Thermaurantiacus sp.]MCS6985925.1 tryptophan--tRNA ligase [Sphingomonadaceae bacterium]MDW8414859.1 tryptophan--tRNA ligase [Thermaurantiacus sp.]
MTMRRIVSGIQPTGHLHLGNYLGAIRQWVDMQRALRPEDEAFFFIADLHAITVRQDPRALREGIRAMAAALLAAGVDPQRATLFCHSQVPAHAELAWILGCVARVGWLNRMTQFKEKSGKDREGASVGLYTYPVLQAADVLVYRATHVPVGEDQKQHLELARDIALKFNTDFGVELFALPEPTIPPTAPRVRSLRDGTVKMSKSDPSDYSRINLTDPPELVSRKIQKARTDPEPLPATAAGLEGRPEAQNLVEIMAALTRRTPDEVCAEFAGRGFADFKPALTEAILAELGPVSARWKALMADRDELDRILASGAERARAAAAPLLAEVRRTVGLP